MRSSVSGMFSSPHGMAIEGTLDLFSAAHWGVSELNQPRTSKFHIGRSYRNFGAANPLGGMCTYRGGLYTPLYAQRPSLHEQRPPLHVQRPPLCVQRPLVRQEFLPLAWRPGLTRIIIWPSRARIFLFLGRGSGAGGLPAAAEAAQWAPNGLPMGRPALK